MGTEFAGYRITRIIGRGGMSNVYEAEHIHLGRLAAVKVLSPALAADDSFRARFARESQLVAALDHSRIVTIYDAGEADGVLFIAMRLVHGEDLATLIEREGPLSVARVRSIVEQVGDALDHAHDRGLIHRDVKPANILIETRSERAYLTDFGIVKESSSHGLTKTGFFLGTFEYAAPEQIESREVDGRTDVYALGCVLYECLSAEAPFAGETAGAVIRSHLVEPPPTLTGKRPELPPAIDGVIATAMAKSMDSRYRTCAELVRAFRAATTGSGAATESGARAQATVQSAPATRLAESAAHAPPPADRADTSDAGPPAAT